MRGTVLGRRDAVALGRCELVWLAGVPATGAGLLVAVALTLLPLGIGFLLLPPAATTLRRVADRHRERTARWSGRTPDGPEPLPQGTSARRTSAAILGDDGFWRDLRWSFLEPWAGGVAASVPPMLVLYGVLGACVQPFVWPWLGPDNWYAFVPVVSTPTMLAALLLGLAFIAAGLRLAAPMLDLATRLGQRMLAPPRSAELARRVVRLTDTRSAALDIHAAELTRIERDLHDGAQARLVALGLTLDEATRLLDTDPPAAHALLLDVRATSERALQDLRDLVHGIHPPVLADRGLTDAIRSLALDSHLDVEVHAGLAGRLPAPVESAAYFAVAELLANAAKHAQATRVGIALEHDDTRLRITVTDNGVGGADPSSGTGLAGLRRRLDPFDGTLALDSPVGGPTLATLEIPCASSSPKTSSCSATG